MRSFWFIFILALLGLQYKLWLGDGNVKELMRLQAKNDEQDIYNQKLRRRNQILSAEIAELKSGEQALEEKARYDLGMIKPDETFYHLVD